MGRNVLNTFEKSNDGKLPGFLLAVAEHGFNRPKQRWQAISLSASEIIDREMREDGDVIVRTRILITPPLPMFVPTLL
jgi:hypothetical protein